VGTLLDVIVLKFFIVGVDSGVVELPSGVYLRPYSCDSVRGPCAAGVLVCPSGGFFEMGILESRPLCGPVSSEEGGPSDLVLCSNSTLTMFGIPSGVDGFAIKPCIYAFDENYQ
jgi:hypothetical protein